MAETRISAEDRNPRHATNRALRRSGLVPGVYYNRKGEVRCLQFNAHDLTNLLRQEIGLLRVDVAGESLDCIIRDVQRHPVRRDVIHIDLMGIVSGQKITAHVPIHVLGSAAGVKEGGTLELVMRDIEVECEPANLPTHIDVDVTHLAMNEAIRIGDLRIEGVLIFGDPQSPVVHVVPPRAVAEPTPVAEAAPAEPEVIRERKPAEGEEEEKEKPKERK
jgi:large subunit ribosomal protein L25